MTFLSILFCLLPFQDIAAGESFFKLDFDDGKKLGQMFRANGKVTLSSGELPAADASENGASGRAMNVRTENDFAFYTIDDVANFDPETADTIRFQIYNPTGKQQRFDFFALEPDRKALFWRKVSFDHDGWKTFELPMEWFRWSPGRVPQWENISSIGIRGGAGLKFWIDGLEVVDRAADKGPNQTVSSIINGVFKDPKSVRHKAEDDVWLITNSDEIDIDKLHTHLTKVRDYVLEIIPRWKTNGATTKAPVLIVAQDRKDYQSLFTPFGERYVATIAAPNSGGFTVQGVGFSYFDPDYGTIRPVFSHEFTHSIACQLGRNDIVPSPWFDEGLATLVHIHFHPQPGVAKIIQAGMEDPEKRMPLERLTRGRIALNRYWQAWTLLDFLMNDAEMKPKFNDLVARFEATGKTDLSLHLKPVYGIDFGELEEKWQDYVAENMSRFDPEM